MQNLDAKGYYAALNVGPRATHAEIQLSYKLLKKAYNDGRKLKDIGKIRQAYRVVGDRELRARYDGEAKPPARKWLNSGWLLLVVVGLFFGSLFMVFGSDIMAPFVSFDVGDRLYWKKADNPLGEVLEYQVDHAFAEGPSQAAYLIRFRSGQERWFPAVELHRDSARR